MPVERRGWVTHGVCWVNGKPEEPSSFAGRRQPSLSGTSRMRRESHVRICERLGVKFPGSTRRLGFDGVIIEIAYSECDRRSANGNINQKDRPPADDADEPAAKQGSHCARGSSGC